MSSLMVCFSVLLFFFKQKTAYEMRISDWSSDVCSSDLALHHVQQDARIALADAAYQRQADGCHRGGGQADRDHALHRAGLRAGDRQRLLELAQHEKGVDRKRVVEGKSVTVRVDLGGSRSSKKTNSEQKVSQLVR